MLRAISDAIDAVARAKESGLDVERAEAALTEAQETLAEGDDEAARERAHEARLLAEDAKRHARAAGLVERARSEVEGLRRSGGDATVAASRLGEAEAALARGTYGEVQALVRQARETVAESRRRGNALALLEREVARARTESQRGVDIAAVEASFTAARAAIDSGSAPLLRKALNEARLALKLALEHKRIEDSCTAVREELEELAHQGAVVDAARGHLEVAVHAGTELREAWHAVGRARRTLKAAREQLNRDTIVNTVQRIVEHAASGE
ncbi:MAG TPA: hypothetical protein VJ397_11265, partial [Thermoplasmata archaeon]|nr:hypothetical protein [Thermoplasmata archaeon]